MSDVTPPGSPAAVPLPTLAELRQRIDAIDTQLIDLLVARAEVVETVGAVKRAAGEDVGIFLRPGREMDILRRLLKQAKDGRFRKSVIVRIWRELFAAMVAVEGPLTAAVYMPSRGAGFLELARDSYGAYTPMVAVPSPGSVVKAVANAEVTVGILPMPHLGDTERWWPALASAAPGTPSVVGRVPFAGPGPGRGDGIEGLVICRLPQEDTGHDRTYIVIEADEDLSRTGLRSLAENAGLVVAEMPDTDDTSPVARLHLLEIETCVLPTDQRLVELGRESAIRRVSVIGGYAIPFTADDLA
ncbi:chorismate mutase [Novispirillum itersonii]|uniref:chorismate mutase n=1 Tax=Novispirillum itersonii TaxID=189 RepID=UPI000381D182|nr:chorismate mutase [Novispirillum itersonii]